MEHPSEKAFLTNPVASSTDRTGFAVTVPPTEDSARELSEMFGNIPLTSHKRTKRDKYKRMSSKHKG
ncbi:MAG: hypothetical protein J6L92_01615 [Clostridia bacterium]|nr:hypothetical protein [Clostridia bacterium]